MFLKKSVQNVIFCLTFEKSASYNVLRKKVRLRLGDVFSLLLMSKSMQGNYFFV